MLVRDEEPAAQPIKPPKKAPAPKPVKRYIPRHEKFDQLVAAAVGRDLVATQRVPESIRPIVLRYCRARIGQLDRSFAFAVCGYLLNGGTTDARPGKVEIVAV
ncbi:hypothetical protein [Kutzneria buriramensis]|uniref:hypothetical protein n=1 Tax=Kutzneria buriramensis TaxID=1045776 RepID=UPI0011C13815|nr:hypothetical protein [Kutzneria buriramensis]